MTLSSDVHNFSYYVFSLTWVRERLFQNITGNLRINKKQTEVLMMHWKNQQRKKQIPFHLVSFFSPPKMSWKIWCTYRFPSIKNNIQLFFNFYINLKWVTHFSVFCLAFQRHRRYRGYYSYFVPITYSNIIQFNLHFLAYPKMVKTLETTSLHSQHEIKYENSFHLALFFTFQTWFSHALIRFIVSWN